MSGRSTTVPIALVLAAGCAGQLQQTIEPPPPQAARGSDPDFVLSRRPVEHVNDGPLPVIHTAEAWWPFRAQFLGMSERQARERDAAIPDRQRPERFWDEQTATEAVNLWTALCNECHGGRRRLEDALAMPGPAPAWGRGEGVFFGRRRPYSEVFEVISNGGPERRGIASDMPAWRVKIAKEQIWALLYFLEYQSGAIDGPLPPSLQPRRGGEVRRVLQ
jgi:hypothetical protein